MPALRPRRCDLPGVSLRLFFVCFVSFVVMNGGVTARTFLTSSSTARLSPDALAGLASPTLALADHEGFPAHANAFRLRGLTDAGDGGRTRS